MKRLALELLKLPQRSISVATLAFGSGVTGVRGAMALMDFILAAFGIVLVGNSVSSIWSQPDQFFTPDTGRNFFLVLPLRPWLLRRATRQFLTLPTRTNADVNQIISDILNCEHDEEARPTEDPIKVGALLKSEISLVRRD